MAVALYPFDHLESLLALQRNLEQSVGNPRGLDLGPSGSGVFPPINIFSDSEGFVVKAEVPGVAPDAIQLTFDRGTLTISGERAPEQKKANGGSHHRRERRFGKFSRSLRLPVELAGDRAVAKCRDGTLTVRIPTREEAKPRQIKVQAS